WGLEAPLVLLVFGSWSRSTERSLRNHVVDGWRPIQPLSNAQSTASGPPLQGCRPRPEPSTGSGESLSGVRIHAESVARRLAAELGRVAPAGQEGGQPPVRDLGIEAPE